MTPRADLTACGVIACDLLTSRPPQMQRDPLRFRKLTALLLLAINLILLALLLGNHPVSRDCYCPALRHLLEFAARSPFHFQTQRFKDRVVQQLASRAWFALLVVLALPGCSGIATRMADNLSTAVLNQNDPETVRAGAPSYLILIDSLIADDPRDTDLLLTGARLYGAYAGIFVDEPERKKRLAVKSLEYARRATCLALDAVCAALDQRADTFENSLDDTGRDDITVLYGLATSWLGLIQADGEDWNAVADLPKVTALFKRVEALDERYDNGNVHAYLGVLNSQLPPALGGKPEVGRAHFERALELSGGINLMTKVLYARYYARLTFDQTLHDRLLREVMAAKAEQPGLTLVNTFAQQQAEALLKSGKDYF